MEEAAVPVDSTNDHPTISTTDAPVSDDRPPAPMEEADDMVEQVDSTNEPLSTGNATTNTPVPDIQTPAPMEEVPCDDEVVKSKTTTQGLKNDLPLSIDGPPLPEAAADNITEEPPIDYTLVLKEGTNIRDYQRELAQPGIEGKNYVVVAPTGSGKTLVAALVISDHLQKGKELEEEKARKVAFIVDKRPLAQQQAKELGTLIPAAKIACCIGDDTTVTVSSSLDSGVHIIVCTAGKVVDDLKNGRISLSMFSLIIFDECHHTRKKSPYADVMMRYIRDKVKRRKLPQVVGMTASPGAGDNPHLEKTVTIDHLVKLCSLMDATSGIKTVRENKPELEEFTNKPDYNVENSKNRDLTEPFIQKIVELMQKLERKVGFTCPFDRWDQKYETQVQQNKFALEKTMDPKSRDKTRIWELLRRLNRTLDVYMELQYEDAISELKKSELYMLQKPNQAETELHHSLETLLAHLKSFPRVGNPHLERVKTLLAEHFKKEPKTRAMLFVRTKKHATSIYNWIKSLSFAEELGIHPCMVVGQVAGTTGDGMTQAEQENSFQSFREGRSNVLVVTSIGEEGIDVPACNLVLRYMHVSNEIAKAQTLGRARATGISEGYTLLSSSKKHMQEVKNGELLALVDKILLDRHFPSELYLIRKINDEQEKLLKKADIEKARIDQQRSTYRPEEVQLICVMCKVPACCAADIRTINTNYVVPGEEFQNRIIKKTNPIPTHKAAMSITQRIFCKNCNHPWGISCVWPTLTSGNQFPVLSCKSFTFVAKGLPITVKKWSEAPFTVKEFDGFPKPDDESDSDCEV